ncbi:MAG: hypothetical protein M3N11_02955 [Actinomycetota bacterium]|nr:hypothetical protein [Actinomycetota bacterium]
MRLEHRTPATVVDRRGNAVVDGGAGDLSPTERPALIGALETSDRFHRDTTPGRIFHPRKISFREISAVDSLHIVIDGNRVSAHVDEISPLRRRPDGSIGYSPWRILAHNLSGACADVARFLRGQHGAQRCNLECEVVWIDDDPANPLLPEAPAGAQGRPAPERSPRAPGTATP